LPIEETARRHTIPLFNLYNGLAILVWHVETKRRGKNS